MPFEHARRLAVTGPGSFALSMLMLAAFLLGGAGMWLISKRRDLKKGVLMLVAALVFLGNVLIWTI